MVNYIELGTVSAILSTMVVWLTRFADRQRKDYRQLIENHLKHNTEALSKVAASLEATQRELYRRGRTPDGTPPTHE